MDKTTVKLSADSALIACDLDTIADWWPQMEKDDPKDACQTQYPARTRGRKKRASADLEEQPKAKPKAKPKKTKKPKLKKPRPRRT